MLAATDSLDRLKEELGVALGADYVIDSEAVRAQHSMGESFHKAGLPDVVVHPGSTEDVVAVVQLCRAYRVPLVPFGAGTSLEGHVVPLQGGVSLDTSRLNRIVRLSVEDLDVQVESGVTRKQLDARLRPEGVFFPVDPGADATIGGMVATGASGTTTVRYGAMRENVLSLTVVTPEGEVVRTRSRARKSSAGYDLTHLFIGSEGTLGVITDATLRIYPSPEAISAAVCSFTSLDAAVRVVIETIQLGIPVARIELLDDVQMDAVNRRSALGYPVAHTLKTSCGASAVNLLYFVSFRAVDVPRFMLGRDIGKIVRSLTFRVIDFGWRGAYSRHKKIHFCLHGHTKASWDHELDTQILGGFLFFVNSVTCRFYYTFFNFP